MLPLQFGIKKNMGVNQSPKSPSPFGSNSKPSFQTILYRAAFHLEFSEEPLTQSTSSSSFDVRMKGGASIAPLAVTCSSFFNSTFGVNVVERIGLTKQNIRFFELFLGIVENDTRKDNFSSSSISNTTLQFARNLEFQQLSSLATPESVERILEFLKLKTKYFSASLQRLTVDVSAELIPAVFGRNILASDQEKNKQLIGFLTTKTTSSAEPEKTQITSHPSLFSFRMLRSLEVTLSNEIVAAELGRNLSRGLTPSLQNFECVLTVAYSTLNRDNSAFFASPFRDLSDFCVGLASVSKSMTSLAISNFTMQNPINNRSTTATNGGTREESENRRNFCKSFAAIFAQDILSRFVFKNLKIADEDVTEILEWTEKFQMEEKQKVSSHSALTGVPTTSMSSMTEVRFTTWKQVSATSILQLVNLFYSPSTTASTDCLLALTNDYVAMNGQENTALTDEVMLKMNVMPALSCAKTLSLDGKGATNEKSFCGRFFRDCDELAKNLDHNNIRNKAELQKNNSSSSFLFQNNNRLEEFNFVLPSSSRIGETGVDISEDLFDGFKHFSQNLITLRLFKNAWIGSAFLHFPLKNNLTTLEFNGVPLSKNRNSQVGYPATNNNNNDNNNNNSSSILKDLAVIFGSTDKKNDNNSLRNLYLCQLITSISFDDVANGICCITSLEELVIQPSSSTSASSERINDEWLAHFNRLTQLKKLTIQLSPISTTGMCKLDRLENLTEVNFDFCAKILESDLRTKLLPRKIQDNKDNKDDILCIWPKLKQFSARMAYAGSCATPLYKQKLKEIQDEYPNLELLAL